MHRSHGKAQDAFLGVNHIIKLSNNVLEDLLQERLHITPYVHSSNSQGESKSAVALWYKTVWVWHGMESSRVDWEFVSMCESQASVVRYCIRSSVLGSRSRPTALAGCTSFSSV